jgi:hypothetical protein
MALSGTLKDFGIADILQLIGQQTKTGQLYLDSGQDNVQITFINGNVVFASEKRRDKAHLLGNLLRRAEMISEEQLDAALEEQKRTMKRLGDILVSGALISEMQLSQLARLQATETLYRLFHWKSGTYEFTQGEVDVGKPAFEPLRAESILLEGFRRMDEWGPLRKRIPSNLCSFERAKELPIEDEDPGSTDVGLAPLDSSGESDAPGERHKLLYKLAVAAPGRTAEKIVDLSRLGEFETLKALEQLMTWGHLKLVPAPRGSERMRKLAEGGRSLHARGAFLQVAVTAACLLAALFLLRMAVPAFAGRTAEVPARPGAAARVLAHGQLLRLESALEVYRLEHGTYPEQLDKLVEGQLVAEGDLRWPFRGPYHYRRTAQGFVLLPPLD